MKANELTTKFIIGKRYKIFIAKTQSATNDINDYRLLFTANVMRTTYGGGFLKLNLSNCKHECSGNFDENWEYTTNFQVKFMEVESLEFKSSHRQGVEL